jgi:uncharacterized protein (DUF427 family)
MSAKIEHYAITETSSETYQLLQEGKLILETNQAVLLREHYAGKDYPAVIYFPVATVSALQISKTRHATFCPIKGHASYWSWRDLENCIWSYENPVPGVERIKGHYAFDQNRGFNVISKR